MAALGTALALDPGAQAGLEGLGPTRLQELRSYVRTRKVAA